MESDRITNAMRAAVTLLHFDDSEAEQIVENLNIKEMRELTLASQQIAELTQEDVEEILNHFVIESKKGMTPLRTAEEFVANLARKTLGDKTAQDLMEATGAGGLAQLLEGMDVKMLGNVLSKEHPQTIALVMAYIPPLQSSGIIAALPEEVQPQVIRRLASIDSVDPDMVKMIEEALMSELETSVGTRGITRKIGGAKLVADIMNQMERSSEEALMQRLEDSDESLAETVRGLMFVFDDILNIDSRGVQTLLKEVERDTLVLALKAAGDDIRDYVFTNLSQRAAEMIQDDMEARGPVRLRDVQKAQAEVVQAALRLASSGAIEIVKGDQDAMVE